MRNQFDAGCSAIYFVNKYLDLCESNLTVVVIVIGKKQVVLTIW
jgi:hypothetical protein